MDCIYCVRFSTVPNPSRGTHIAPSISYQPPLATSALIHSVHGLDHGCPSHRFQQAQLQTQSLENRPAVRGPHPINPPLVVATADGLDPYLIVANKWAGRGAPAPLLRLLRSSFSQPLVNLCYNWKKQNKLDLNNNNCNKLKVLKTKIIISTYVCNL